MQEKYSNKEIKIKTEGKKTTKERHETKREDIKKM